ncbi:hypothetical protein Rhopal_001033-T1 [Rhodotorula paludigena]|uniref:GPI inositol-deacylase n=1 Tax=Rhodotorula paludigena TaxID=86838 RepID=A0AAV5GFE9_9BASI|nr:hypothetical protein Rhopal_001033-T1 [Rhodotorula paludigena]
MAQAAPQELVIAVLVHGFKGGADTLYSSLDNHVTWLIQTVAEKQARYRELGGTGPVRLILMGHSMGGLVIADSLLSTLPSASLPILGLIAYDSPLIGLNPAVFKSTFDKALDVASKGQAALAALGAGYGLFKSATGKKPSAPDAAASRSAAEQKKTQSSKEVAVPPPAESASATPGSNWMSLPYLAAAGLAGAGAAFGAAYYNRDTLARHWTWATSHLSFVGELWKTDELERRLENVVAAREKGVGFHCTPDRTFLVLPHNAVLRAHFSPATDARRDIDEIKAHCSMFDQSPGTYALGQETAKLITEWVESARRGEMGFWRGEGAMGTRKQEEKLV